MPLTKMGYISTVHFGANTTLCRKIRTVFTNNDRMLVMLVLVEVGLGFKTTSRNLIMGKSCSRNQFSDMNTVLAQRLFSESFEILAGRNFEFY